MISGTGFFSRARMMFRRIPKEPILASNHAWFASRAMDLRLADCNFVVLDTELTGLDARGDEIVSIGAVRIRGMAIQTDETFSCLVEPKKGLPKSSTLIHHITPEQVKNRPRLRQVLPGLVEFLNGSLIVGHNIGLDMGFLSRACRTVFGDTIANPCLDTMRMAQIYREQQWENYYDQFDLNVSYNLSDLSEEYGLPRFPEHDALGDALQTAYLFLYLVRKLSGGGIESLKDLFDAGRSWRWYF